MEGAQAPVWATAEPQIAIREETKAEPTSATVSSITASTEDNVDDGIYEDF
jgi:hypothetical protein